MLRTAIPLGPLESQGLLKGCDRFVQPIHFCKRLSEIVVGFGKITTKPDGGVKFGDCQIDLPGLCECDAKPVVKGCVVRLQSNGMTKTGDRLIDPSCVAQKYSEIRTVIWSIRPERNCATDQFDRSLRLIGLAEDDAEQMKRIGMIGLFGKNLPVNLFRLAQPALAMMG